MLVWYQNGKYAAAACTKSGDSKRDDLKVTNFCVILFCTEDVVKKIQFLYYNKFAEHFYSYFSV